MSDANSTPLVSLPTVARAAGVSWLVAWNAILRRELDAVQISGRWFCTPREAARYARAHQAKRKAGLHSPSTAGVPS